MGNPSVSSSVVQFGVFRADLDSGLLHRDGIRVRLQEQPFRILALLLERPGQVVTRESIRQTLWPDGTFVDFDGGLNAAIKKLRVALSDDSDEPRFIETIPKRGYRFIAAVTQEVARTAGSKPNGDSGSLLANGAPGAATGALTPGWTLRPTGQRIAVVLALVLVVTVGIAAYRWYGHGRTAGNSPEPAMTPIPTRRAIAVLRFSNISGKTEDAWLATALSEMMSTELAAGGKLRLVPGEEVSHLQLASPWSRNETLGQATTSRIGTALNSDLLLLGTYTSLGSHGNRQLRLDARLQDAKTGEILTEVAATGSHQNLFQLVSVIGEKMRKRLGVPNPEETDEASVRTSLPSDPDAVRLYTMGLVKLREYDHAAARDFFEQAVKAEPKFPLAHSMLSRAQIFLGHDEQARVEAKRGLDLAGNLSRVGRMEIEASYYHAVEDRAKAAEIYRVLFDLFPDSLEYGLQLSKLQLESYQPDAALETIRRLRRLPAPARDDPGLDLREAYILYQKDKKEADRLFHSASEKAASQGKKLLYAKAKQNLCFENQQHLQLPPECREAYEIFLAAGNRDEAGSSLQLQAEANRQTGHYQESIPLYQKALRLLREAGDREKVGVAQNNLSLVLEHQGQWGQAEQMYRDALQNFQAVNDKANSAEAIANIADILVMRGQLRPAEDLYRKAWELADSSGRGRHEYAHIQHGALLLMRGDLEQSRAEIEAQIDSLRAYGGESWLLANALTARGDIEVAAGNLEGARRNYSEALQIRKTDNIPVGSTQVLLAKLSEAENQPSAAELMLRQAIAEFEKEQNTGDEIEGYTALGSVLLRQAKLTEARDAITHASKLANLRDFPTLDLPLQMLKSRARIANAQLGMARQHELTAAALELHGVIQQTQRLGLYSMECESRLELGDLELMRNPALGRTQLASLAMKTRRRGFELLARRSEEAIRKADGAASANQPAP